MDQKTFESRHSGGCESFNVTLIIVNDPAPRRPIDAAFALRRCALGLKRRDGRGRGKAIQGHIDEHRVTSRCRGSGRGFETLPLGTARIVDMHVRIDEPGKNRRVAEVMDFVTVGRHLIGRNDGLDPLAFHKDGRRADSFGSDHAASEEGLQTQDVSSLEDCLRGRAYRGRSTFAMHAAAGIENNILRNSESRLILASQRSGCERVHVD